MSNNKGKRHIKRYGQIRITDPNKDIAKINEAFRRLQEIADDQTQVLANSGGGGGSANRPAPPQGSVQVNNNNTFSGSDKLLWDVDGVTGLAIKSKGSSSSSATRGITVSDVTRTDTSPASKTGILVNALDTIDQHTPATAIEVADQTAIVGIDANIAGNYAAALGDVQGEIAIFDRNTNDIVYGNVNGAYPLDGGGNYTGSAIALAGAGTYLGGLRGGVVSDNNNNFWTFVQGHSGGSPISITKIHVTAPKVSVPYPTFAETNYSVALANFNGFGGVHPIVYSPNDNTALFSAGTTVYKLNLGSGTLSGLTFPTPDSGTPSLTEVSGNTVWAYTNNHYYKLDATTFTLLDTATPANFGLVAGAGQTLVWNSTLGDCWIIATDNKLYRLHMALRTKTSSIVTGLGGYTLALDTVNNKVILSQTGGANLQRVNISNDTADAPVALGYNQTSGFGVDPNGYVWVADNNAVDSWTRTYKLDSNASFAEVLHAGSNSLFGFQKQVARSSSVSFMTFVAQGNSGNYALKIHGGKVDLGPGPTIIGSAITDAEAQVALKAGIQQESYTYATATGGTNTYEVTLTPTPAGYTTGMGVVFKTNAANTGSATLNVNSLGAKTLKNGDGSSLTSGQLSSGQIVSVVYDGTNFQLVGGTTLPGGSDKNVQYNNAGAFGGVANNSTATKKYLQQVSSGTPSYQQIAIGDLSDAYGELGITIDGGGAVPTTGSKGFLSAKFPGTITEWELIGDQASGSAQVTIKKGTPGSDTTMPSTSSIVASAPPVLSAAQRKRSTTLTSWTTSFALNDVFEFNLDSVTTHTRLTLIVRFQKT